MNASLGSTSRRRVVSANLLFGMSLTDGVSDLSRVCEALSGLHADVLAIQEVDRFQPRSANTDQTAEISAATGCTDFRFVPAIVGEPGGQWRAATDHDDGSESSQDVTDGSGPTALTNEHAAPNNASTSYGIGLMLRMSVVRWHVVRLKASKVVSPIMMPGTKKLIWLRDEPRVLLCAEVTPTKGFPFRTIATTHLSFVPGVNVRQLRRVKQALLRLPGPHLLVGDLNLPGPIARQTMRWTSLHRGPTYPTLNPKIQFDHVFSSVSPEHGRFRSSSSAQSLPFSDHQVVVVDFHR